MKDTTRQAIRDEIASIERMTTEMEFLRANLWMFVQAGQHILALERLLKIGETLDPMTVLQRQRDSGLLSREEYVKQCAEVFGTPTRAEWEGRPHKDVAERIAFLKKHLE